MLSLRPLTKPALFGLACSILVVISLAWPAVGKAGFVPGRGLDQSFQSGSGLDGTVNAMQLQSDGKLVVAGSFTNYNGVERNQVARFHPDGTLDSLFNPNLGIASLTIAGAKSVGVSFLTLQSDGKFLVVVNFREIMSYMAIAKLVRLNNDGSLDNSFSPGTITDIFSINLSTVSSQADNKVIIAGRFNNYSGQPVNRVTRLNVDGTLDSSFTPMFSSKVDIDIVALQPDGKIVYAGDFAGSGAITLLRLNADGTPDNSFALNPGFNNKLKFIQFQADGKIVVVGNFNSFAGTSRPLIARMNPDGSLDNSFYSNIVPEQSGYLNALGLQSDGKIIVAGRFTPAGERSRSRLARLNPDGSPDSTFPVVNAIAGEGILAVAVQDDNKILVGGNFQAYNGTGRSRLVRLNTDSTLDNSFETGRRTGADGYVTSLAAQPDGKVLIGGYFTSYNGSPANGIARLNSDGSLDTSFNVGIGPDRPGIETLILQPDGKIVLGGPLLKFNGVSSRSVARLNSDGSLDNHFQAATGFTGIKTMLLQPDGKIVLGGQSNGHLIRLNSDGTFDNSINLKFEVEDSDIGPQVQVLALQNDGKILFGGHFSKINGESYTNLARLNANGTLDTTFKPDFNLVDGSLTALAVQPNGKILAGGYLEGTTRLYPVLKRFNADGTLDMDFPTYSFGTFIDNLVLQSDGKFLAGGFFQGYSDQPLNTSLIRINPDGSLDNSFAAQVDMVYAIALQTDNKVLLGGSFSAVNGYTRDSVARLQAADTCDPLIVTINTDDGAASQCGTFSWALAHATSGQTIMFGLNQGNIVTFSGSLTPRVPAGVAITGGTDGIVLDGSGLPGDGLELSGNNTLTKLTIRRFAGRELVLSGSSGNRLYQVYAQN